MSICFTTVCSLKSPNRPGVAIESSFSRKVIGVNEVFLNSRTVKIRSLEVKATDGNQSSTKLKSLVCADCDGNVLWEKSSGRHVHLMNNVDDLLGDTYMLVNLAYRGSNLPIHLPGAVHCSQCKGTGVNSVDHFNGQFKAGGLCWLCRGKREILCGNCNGAGFVGGFMSTFDS